MYLPDTSCVAFYQNDMWTWKNLKSSRPSDAYMRLQDKPLLVQAIICRLFSPKPLSKPISYKTMSSKMSSAKRQVILYRPPYVKYLIAHSYEYVTHQNICWSMKYVDCLTCWNRILKKLEKKHTIAHDISGHLECWHLGPVLLTWH